jgi:beta-1,4-N-acetylglucosaminyltransferase
MKTCLISSSGGHLSQLKEIIKVLNKEDYFLVTENNPVNLSLKNSHKVYFLNQQERKNPMFLWNMAVNVLKSIKILATERPKVIITTGAGAVIPMAIIGKLMGCKLVFIESFAKVNSPTLTGRILYRFADQFYIQWEDLRKYYPKALYRGTIY